MCPMVRILLVLSLLTSPIFVICTRGQTPDDRAEKQIDSLFTRYNSFTPGVAVAVVKDGRLLLQKGYGIANLEYTIPITARTVFHAASLSKQFTAFSIYLLEKEGKLSMEDDIRTYMPEVPDFGKTVRIKHLLAHTSGIRDQWAILTLAGWRMDDVITTEQILKQLSRQEELNFEPGSQYSYSNSGYTLLAEMVKRITGKSFAHFTRQMIFDPLGMTNTQFYDDVETIVKNRAYSYEMEKGDYKKKNLNYSTVGATSLLTTVEDLSKWALNFDKPVVGDAELIARFNQVATLANGRPALYAVIDGDSSYHAKGQFVRNYRGMTLYNHGGHDAGFRAYFVRFPDKGLSVITLSNDEHYEVLKSGLTISEFYLQNDLRKKQAMTPSTKANEPGKRPENSSGTLTDLAGRFYSVELNTDYVAVVKEGKLFLTHTRLSDIELTEIGTDKFSGRLEFPVVVDFIRNRKKAVTGLRISNFGATNVWFKKM